MAEWKYTEEDFAHQLAAAEAAEVGARSDPQAIISARLTSGQIPALEIKFRSGGLVKAPVAALRELKDAPLDLVARVQVNQFGRALDWPELDAHIGVSAILADCFGFDSLGEVARRGGRTRSAAKTQAARENGKKGGRPKKKAV